MVNQNQSQDHVQNAEDTKMTLVEKLSLRLTEDQRAVFLQLVQEHADIPVHDLYRQVIKGLEE